MCLRAIADPAYRHSQGSFSKYDIKSTGQTNFEKSGSFYKWSWISYNSIKNELQFGIPCFVYSFFVVVVVVVFLALLNPDFQESCPQIFKVSMSCIKILYEYTIRSPYRDLLLDTTRVTIPHDQPEVPRSRMRVCLFHAGTSNALSSDNSVRRPVVKRRSWNTVEVSENVKRA